MGTKTGISWTGKTWNPWRGCHKLSPGCRNCYMFAEQIRYKLTPGPNTVVRTKTWNDPFRWNREAEHDGQAVMVFTCSWSDFFIEEADQWRSEAWAIIRTTPWLTYQILTKRPERIIDCLPPDWGDGYKNVWLGTSIENADYLWRSDVLRCIPAHIRFISAEPLLGPLTGLNLTGYHWLIAGGESGQDFRLMHHDWARELRDLCATNNVAFFYKQGNGVRSGMNDTIDGNEHKNYPADSNRIPLAMVSD